MGDGAVSADKPQGGVITLEPVVIEIPKPGPAADKPVTPPSPDQYKKLITQAQSLGIKLDYLDDKGNVLPEKLEEVKKRITAALEIKMKDVTKHGLKPEDSYVFPTVLAFLLTETEFGLLSPDEQKKFLAGTSFPKEKIDSYKPTEEKLNKRMALAIRLEGLKQEKDAVWMASRLFDLASDVDPQSTFLIMEAARMKKRWADKEEVPLAKEQLYSEAVQGLQLVLKRDPDNKVAKGLMAGFLSEQAKAGKLAAEQTKDPKLKQKLYETAIACMDESIRFYSKVIDDPKIKADSYKLKAEILSSAGKEEEAKTATAESKKYYREVKRLAREHAKEACRDFEEELKKANAERGGDPGPGGSKKVDEALSRFTTRLATLEKLDQTDPVTKLLVLQTKQHYYASVLKAKTSSGASQEEKNAAIKDAGDARDALEQLRAEWLGKLNDPKATDAVHLQAARFVVSIDKDLMKNPMFLGDERKYADRLSADLDQWQGAVDGLEFSEENAKKRMNEYGSIAKEWLSLRDKMRNTDTPLEFSLNESDINNSKLSVLKGRMVESAAFMKSPGAQDAVDALLGDIIGSDDPKLRVALTYGKLELYAKGVDTLHKSFEEAKKIADPKEKRTALIQLMGQAIQLHASRENDDIITALRDGMKDEPGSVKIQVYSMMNQLMAGSGMSGVNYLKDEGAKVANGLLSEDAGSNVANAKNYLLAKTYFDSIQDKDGADAANKKLESLRTNLLLSIGGAKDPITDPKERFDAVNVCIQIDQNLLTKDFADASKLDDEGKKKFNDLLKAKLEGYRAFLSGTEGIPNDKKMEATAQLAILESGYLAAAKGENSPIDKDMVKEQIKALEKDLTASFEKQVSATDHPFSEDEKKILDAVKADFGEKLHSAILEGKTDWLMSVNGDSAVDFAQKAQAAEVLLMDAKVPGNPKSAERYLQAAQIFSRLGVKSKVKECTDPIIDKAFATPDVKERVGAIFNLVQLFEQAGMKEESGGVLDRAIALNKSDAPVEIKQMAGLMKAMKDLNNGDLALAKISLQYLPEPNDPMAKMLLGEIEKGEKQFHDQFRIGVPMAAIRAEMAAFLQRRKAKGAKNLESEEADMARAADEIQRLVTGGMSFEDAAQKIAQGGGYGDFAGFLYEDGAGWKMKSYLREISRPGITEREISDKTFEFAESLYKGDYFGEAAFVGRTLFKNDFVDFRAKMLVETDIPGEIKWQGIKKGAFSLLYFTPAAPFAAGGTVLFTPTTIGEENGDAKLLEISKGVLSDAILARATFGFARFARVGVEAAFVARIGVKTLEEAPLVMRIAGWGVGTVTEAAAFTGGNMLVQSMLNGNTDVLSLKNFGKEFGSMLVTFALLHGVSSGMQKVEKAVEGSWLGGIEGSKQLMTAASWGVRVTAFTGVEAINEKIGFKEHDNSPFWMKFLSSAITDAQMIRAGKEINAIHVGSKTIGEIEADTHMKYKMGELLPELKKMGFEVDGEKLFKNGFDPKNPPKTPGEIVLQTLVQRSMMGQPLPDLDEKGGKALDGIITDKLGVKDPASPEGQAMKARLLLYSMAHGEEGKPMSAEDLGRTVEKLKTSSKDLLVKSGLKGDAPETLKLADELLNTALDRGVSSEDFEKMIKAAPALKDRLNKIVDTIMGKDGSDTPEGQGLMRQLFVRAFVTAKAPGEIADSLEGLTTGLSDTKDALRVAVNRLLGPGGSRTPQGRELMSVLLLDAINNTPNMADIPEKLSSIGDLCGKPLDGIVTDKFGVKDPVSPEGQALKIQLLLYAMAHGKEGKPMSEGDLSDAVGKMKASSKDLATKSGLKEDAPETQQLADTLLRIALKKGMNPQDFDKMVENASDLKDRLHDIVNTVMGKEGSSTPEGQRLMSQLLVRAFVTAKAPGDLAHSFEDLTAGLSATKDALRTTVKSVLGEGAENTPLGRELMSVLLVNALDATPNMADIPGKLKGIADTWGKALDGIVTEKLGVKDPASEDGQSLKTQLLIYSMTHGVDGKPMSAEDLSRTVDQLKTSSKDLLLKSGLKDGPETQQLADALLNLALLQGMSTQDFETMIQHAPDLKDRLHDIVNTVMGKGGSSTPEGQNLMSQLFVKAFLTTKGPAGLADSLEGLTAGLNDTRDALRVSVNRLLGPGGSSTPEGRELMSSLLINALDTTPNMADIPGRLSEIADASGGAGEALRSKVSFILGEKASQSSQGRFLVTQIFLKALNDSPKMEDLHGNLEKISEVLDDAKDPLRAATNQLLGKGGADTPQGRELMAALLIRTMHNTPKVEDVPGKLSEIDNIAGEAGDALRSHVTLLLGEKASQSDEGRLIVTKLFLTALKNSPETDGALQVVEKITDAMDHLSAPTPNLFDLAGAGKPLEKTALIEWAINTKQTPESLQALSKKMIAGEVEVKFDKGQMTVVDVPADKQAAQKKIVFDRVPLLELDSEHLKTFADKKAEFWAIYSDPATGKHAKTAWDVGQLRAKLAEIQKEFGDDPAYQKEIDQMVTFSRILPESDYARAIEQFENGSKVEKKVVNGETLFFQTLKTPLGEVNMEVGEHVFVAYEKWVASLEDVTAHAKLLEEAKVPELPKTKDGTQILPFKRKGGGQPTEGDPGMKAAARGPAPDLSKRSVGDAGEGSGVRTKVHGKEGNKGTADDPSQLPNAVSLPLLENLGGNETLKVGDDTYRDAQDLLSKGLNPPAGGGATVAERLEALTQLAGGGDARAAEALKLYRKIGREAAEMRDMSRSGDMDQAAKDKEKSLSSDVTRLKELLKTLSPAIEKGKPEGKPEDIEGQGKELAELSKTLEKERKERKLGQSSAPVWIKTMKEFADGGNTLTGRAAKEASEAFKQVPALMEAIEKEKDPQVRDQLLGVLERNIQTIDRWKTATEQVKATRGAMRAFAFDYYQDHVRMRPSAVKAGTDPVKAPVDFDVSLPQWSEYPELVTNLYEKALGGKPDPLQGNEIYFQVKDPFSQKRLVDYVTSDAKAKGMDVSEEGPGLLKMKTASGQEFYVLIESKEAKGNPPAQAEPPPAGKRSLPPTVAPKRGPVVEDVKIPGPPKLPILDEPPNLVGSVEGKLVPRLEGVFPKGTKVQTVTVKASTPDAMAKAIEEQVPAELRNDKTALVLHIEGPNGKHFLVADTYGNLSSPAQLKFMMDGSARSQIFHFDYQVVPGANGSAPRIRIGYLQANKALRENGAVTDAVGDFLDYAKDKYPGATVETQASNFTSFLLMGRKLGDAKFIDAKDPKKNPIQLTFDKDFVDTMVKAGVLSEADGAHINDEVAKINADQQAARSQLQGMVDAGMLNQAQADALVNQNMDPTRAMNLHNFFAGKVRGSFEEAKKNGSTRATDEVKFVMEKFSKAGGLKLIRENPYRGDLWVEGKLPGEWKGEVVEGVNEPPSRKATQAPPARDEFSFEDLNEPPAPKNEEPSPALVQEVEGKLKPQLEKVFPPGTKVISVSVRGNSPEAIAKAIEEQVPADARNDKTAIIVHLEGPEGKHLLVADTYGNLTSPAQLRLMMDGTAPSPFLNLGYEVNYPKEGGAPTLRLGRVQANKSLNESGATGQVVVDFMEFAKKEFPGAKVEMSASDFMASVTNGNAPTEAQFVTILDPQQNPTGLSFDKNFVDILTRVGVLNPAEAARVLKDITGIQKEQMETREQLQEMVEEGSISQDQADQMLKEKVDPKRFADLHNFIVGKIREGYEANKKAGTTSAKDEVAFLSEIFGKNQPYWKDLWVQGKVPGEWKPELKREPIPALEKKTHGVEDFTDVNPKAQIAPLSPLDAKLLPPPSSLLGDAVTGAVRKAIIKDAKANPEDIHEINCRNADLNATIDEIASKVPGKDYPKTLYFIANIKRPDGSHVVNVIKHELRLGEKPKTTPDNNLFVFNYRYSAGSPPRVRVDYVKAREDLRSQTVAPAMKGLVEYASREFPGSVVETRADNLLSAQLAGMNLDRARFVEVTDSKKYPVDKKVDPQLVDLLESGKVLTSEQAVVLKGMIGKEVPDGEKGAQNIAIHNQLIRYVRENFKANPGDASSEVGFFCQGLRRAKGGVAFIRENPYRGDLWVEGDVPPPKGQASDVGKGKTMPPPPGYDPVKADEDVAGRKTMPPPPGYPPPMGDPVPIGGSHQVKVVPLRLVEGPSPVGKEPLKGRGILIEGVSVGKNSEGRILVSDANKEEMTFVKTAKGEIATADDGAAPKLFSLRRLRDGYVLLFNEGVKSSEVKLVSPNGKTEMKKWAGEQVKLVPGDYKIVVDGKEMPFSVPEPPAEPVRLAAQPGGGKGPAPKMKSTLPPPSGDPVNDAPVKSSLDAVVKEGGQVRFLGLEVTPQFEKGLEIFTGGENADPFVDFNVEGARVLLNERNFGRAERKEKIEGFEASENGEAGFDHIVNRHGFGSTNRGELKAGIYAPNVDIEKIDRATVKSWDRVTLSFDIEGKVVFIFQKDFPRQVGITSDGKPTQTNQVILSADGKIVSGFPAAEGKKGYVVKGDLTAGGSNFRKLLNEKSSNDEVARRHEPFLPGSPDADRGHLYLDDVLPYGIINQRTRAFYLEKAPSTNFKEGENHQEEITILKKGKPVKVMATVAEMKFDVPIGVREEVVNGNVVRTPLYCNRTYFIDGNIVGGYPIASFGEAGVPEKVWNPALREKPRAVAAE